MDILDQIVERRIAEAVERGEFDDLPGAGRPLALDDDPLVPAELRVAFRIMRNAGYVPDEVRLFAEVRSAEQLLLQARAEEERVAASARLRMVLERMGSGRATAMQVQSQYFEQLVERLHSAPERQAIQRLGRGASRGTQGPRANRVGT